MNEVMWIAGRRTALARAIAIRDADRTGKPWVKMNHAERSKSVSEIEKTIREWASNGVLLEFPHEYMEARDVGGVVKR